MKICSMRVLCKGLSAIVAVTAFSAYCQGQVASALLREGEILPGETTAILTAINNTAQNGGRGICLYGNHRRFDQPGLGQCDGGCRRDSPNRRDHRRFGADVVRVFFRFQRRR